LAGETEILGENLPQRHFAHHKWEVGISDKLLLFMLSELFLTKAGKAL
jgi:hypothetical protein